MDEFKVLYGRRSWLFSQCNECSDRQESLTANELFKKIDGGKFLLAIVTCSSCLMINGLKAKTAYRFWPPFYGGGFGQKKNVKQGRKTGNNEFFENKKKQKKRHRRSTSEEDEDEDTDMAIPSTSKRLIEKNRKLQLKKQKHRKHKN